MLWYFIKAKKNKTSQAPSTFCSLAWNFIELARLAGQWASKTTSASAPILPMRCMHYHTLLYTQVWRSNSGSKKYCLSSTPPSILRNVYGNIQLTLNDQLTKHFMLYSLTCLFRLCSWDTHKGLLAKTEDPGILMTSQKNGDSPFLQEPRPCLRTMSEFLVHIPLVFSSFH